MNKTILLFFLCFSLSYCCMSQDCELKLRSAMALFEKGDYYNARNMFAEVVKDCGKGEDYGGALGMIQECESKINQRNQTLSVDRNIVSFGPQGGTETIKVNSDASWSWGKRPDWIRLSKSKGRLVVECEGNATGGNRETDITIVGGEGVSKKIHVSQSRSTVSVSTKSITFGEYGGSTYLVTVTSNDDWHVMVPFDSWISVKKTEDGVSVTCDENPTTRERSGYFNVVTSNDESVEISVLQRPSKLRLEMDSSVLVAWNVESYILLVNSNDPDWEAKVLSGGSWCKATKQNEHELLLQMANNDLDNSRTAVIRVSVGNDYKDVTVTQRVLGYVALYEDYFQNIGGKVRITPVSASLYAIGSFGLRISGYMVRWKVAEIDLLNLNASFSKSFLLSWEPMIRGYLPLQRDGHHWTAYLGAGGCIPIIDNPLKPGNEANHSNVVLELGAECDLNWKNYENLSARMFLRLDGYLSVGVALSMFNWK